jgi:hypothetical protein
MEIHFHVTKGMLDGLCRHGWLDESGRHYAGPVTTAVHNCLTAAANDTRLAVTHHRMHNTSPATPSVEDRAAKEAAEATPPAAA